MRFIVGFIVLAILMITSTISVAGNLFEYSYVKNVTVYAPAVSSSGQGVLSKMILALAYPGNGRVFFSALPYTEVETQGAARIAAYIATLVANADFSSYDYFILIESNTPLIGGPSAGGLITVGLTALLLNATISNNVTMTGMINPDGSIGFVGGLKEKLDAAKSFGFTTFLIPAGQRIYSYPVYEEIRRGPFIIRTVRYESIDLVEYGKQIGVNVIEVADIGEAFYYFTGINISRSRMIIEPRNTYFDKLNEASAAIVGKLSRLLADSTSIAQQLSSSYYRSLYLQSISNLNNTMNRLINLMNSYPVYVIYNLLDIYQSALQYYWSLSIGTRLSTLEDLANNVNESIIRAYNELQSNQCNLANSVVQFALYLAWLYYNGFINATDSSAALNYASIALKYVELSKLFNSLSNGSTVLDCGEAKLLELYSHALAVYTYTLSLVEQAGQSSTQLGELNYYVSAIQYMYENKNVGVYASTAFILWYSAKSIHELVGSLNNIVNRGERLVSLYWFSSEDPVVSFYLELLKESMQLNDMNTAAISMFTTVSLLQVLRVAERNAINPTYITPQETSTMTTSTKIQSSQSSIDTTMNTNTNTTTTSIPSASPGTPLKVVDLVVLIILFVVLFAIVAKLKWFNKTQ
ncbi:MAG: S16 family serine protease [Desulfurococcaceae archaeon]